MTPEAARTRVVAPSSVVRPGALLGVVGGGQLGRMFVAAARRLGYRVAVWSDDPDAPALAAADVPLAAGYDDPRALAAFTTDVAAATVEFENLPSATLEAIARRIRLRPGPAVVAATQHRAREKRALRSLGVPLAPYVEVGPARDPASALADAVAHVGRPAVLKTAGFGYDGKGQVRMEAEGAWPEEALRLVADGPCVVEAFVDLTAELSVVVARAADGTTRAFPVAENVHRDGILDLSVVPARVDVQVAERATELATSVIAGLGVVGLACVELFLTRAGDLWVNEVAPRPHNSGHATIEACAVDQFEQQVRALTSLPLGEPALVRPAAMANLLGDLWASGEPSWAEALAVPGVRLHLYGKRVARPGRKMGHLTALADDPSTAADLVLRARAALVGGAAAAPPTPSGAAADLRERGPVSTEPGGTTTPDLGTG